ncbi:choice-of-anchor D domain-containing protein [Granulicella mallensis]|uniref:Endonuclease/exonuclease/phosphatase n=1 Tax=Granulicella mallensis (strain ATCC BAA-1857 / DSM 23137 / MP5ACTX8) TaxID=682795 RepID=G8P286_GRAMM|nr:choice-of-anchor D domain-containing protein [Granulicella mallensis]AEU38232.1 Endonuclease/exonuclease/phosphatase [Granulicella mallensis MP5ACTX8]
MKKLSFSLLLFALLAITFPAFSQTGLVISQLYGGGGNGSTSAGTLATYTNDFIELYNASSAPINLGGLSVQYASSTGTSWNAATLPAVSLPAGHYFLIEAAAGATTVQALPTPDLILTLANVSQSFVINLSATAGKVALVSNTTPLTTSCPTGATILDFVGFGTANCSEGNTPAAAPAGKSVNTASIIRSVSSVDTNNNGSDFSIVNPANPRNSTFGGSVGTLSAIGVANPATVDANQPVTLTVTVTPATSPASTGITVTGDLRLIGGSQTQTFTDNGDGTFSFSTTANTTTDGPIVLPISVADAETHTAMTSISLSVTQPTPTVAIPAIQGKKSTTAATISPFVGQKVTTTGIVTTVLSNGFFIQSQTPDGDPLTPEGIEVFTSSAPPAAAAIGNLVQVTGTVATFPAITASHTPATEISGSPTITLLSTGNPLPAAVTLTAAMLTPSGGLYQLTPYEGMRVAVDSITAVSGTNGSITDANEDAEIATSTGYFYGVIGSTPRPFREPGIDIRDPFTPLPANVAHFDDNPERILVDSTIAGGTSIEISTGAVLPSVTGVLDFTFSSDSFFDPSRLILDASYNRTKVVPGMVPQLLAAPTPGKQFTVASFNIERFYNTSSTDNLYFVPSSGTTATSEAATLTPAAYSRRLQKLSLAIRNVLNTPDIVTIEEVENQSVATDIANQINSDAGVPNLYTGYSTDNTTYFTQDGTGISVGFLVKNSTVDQLSVTQFGQGETFTPTTSNSPITLNDRPWMVLSAGIKRAGASDYPVTVIVNHMKALTGVDSTTSTSTRQKKELQAEDIAKYIQTLQAAGKHVISGGDFNAFEFSDGYTDTLATYTNVNILPSDQVVQPGTAGLVTPSLVDLALNMAPSDRWSYVEDGDAQILDHMVVTPELAAGTQFVYAHLDADFPLTAYNDATTPARTSDHDAAMGYFALPAPTLSATLTPATVDFGSTTVGVASSGQVFTLTNTGEAAIDITSVTATGDYTATSNCGSSLATTPNTCTINVVLTPTATGTRTGTLTVVTSGGTYTSTLTGTGSAPVPTPPSLSSTAVSFPTTALGSTTQQMVTVTNSAAITLPVLVSVSTGDFTQTNTCGTMLAANATCIVTVSFKPTAVGTRTGTLTVTTNGATTASLTGIGQTADFTISGPNGTGPVTQTVTAGSPASIVLTFTPVAGTTTVTLTCTGPSPAPTGASCTAPAAAFTVSGTPVTQTVTITTTSRVASSSSALVSWPKAPSLATAGFGLAGLLMLFVARTRRRGQLPLRIAGLLTLLLVICIPAIGCGGNSTPPVTSNPNGTPAGTYTYTVTANASSGASHTQTITLTVQ